MADQLRKRRAKLHIAEPADAPKSPPYSMVKKALVLFRGRGIDKATRHRNARKWLAERIRMGDKHILKGHQVSWGQPGEPNVKQVYAPRRIGENAR